MIRTDAWRESCPPSPCIQDLVTQCITASPGAHVLSMTPCTSCFKRSLVRDELSHETLEMLSEILLLNRAVKRKSSHMVTLLVQFVLICPDNSKLYTFLPNYLGPGGLTPLHLAASIDDAEDTIDTLTDDPQELSPV